MMKLVALIIPYTIITLSSAINAEDITTISEFQAYNMRTRNTCSSGDVSTCPDPSRSVCLGDYCYKTCERNKDCAKPFMCSYEKLCKPKGCHPCINGPTYPVDVSTTTEEPEPEEDDLDLDASGITTIDEWEEYLRKADAYCPSGDVSECPRQKRRICLDGLCFKQCENDDHCAPGFTCNFEGLCKPENCIPCIKKTMMPTSATTMPPDYTADITTESEFEAYMKRTRNVCPSGDVTECPRPNKSICLDKKCFKKCPGGSDDECAGNFVCNFENLCKPQGCTPCIRATYYPTPQPPSELDEILAVDMDQNEGHGVVSSVSMLEMTSMIGVIVMVFWICGGCMIWRNGEKKKIGEYGQSSYGATETASV